MRDLNGGGKNRYEKQERLIEESGSKVSKIILFQ